MDHLSALGYIYAASYIVSQIIALHKCREYAGHLVIGGHNNDENFKKQQRKWIISVILLIVFAVSIPFRTFYTLLFLIVYFVSTLSCLFNLLIFVNEQVAPHLDQIIQAQLWIISLWGGSLFVLACIAAVFQVFFLPLFLFETDPLDRNIFISINSGLLIFDVLAVSCLFWLKYWSNYTVGTSMNERKRMKDARKRLNQDLEALPMPDLDYYMSRDAYYLEPEDDDKIVEAGSK